MLVNMMQSYFQVQPLLERSNVKGHYIYGHSCTSKTFCVNLVSGETDIRKSQISQSYIVFQIPKSISTKIAKQNHLKREKYHQELKIKYRNYVKP